MNLQSMMQQAQKIQKDMMKAKQEVEEKIFNIKKDFVEIEAKGKKEILKVKVNKKESIDVEEFEIVEDLIMLSVNEVFSIIDREMEEKMKKFGPGMAGLF